MPVKIILSIALLVFWASPAATTTEKLNHVSLELLTDLQQDAELSRQQKLPILIAFTASYCDYCEIVKEEFLKPMLRNDAYRDKVLIREMVLDSYSSVRDFSGKNISPDTLASRYRAYLTPTVVLLGPDGAEIAERLRGITTVDYYGGFLDDAIDTARAKLQEQIPGFTVSEPF